MTTEDWRFSDERMQLRGMVFRALLHHLDDHCRLVYEFCNDWVSQGNKGIDNIEHHFQEFLEVNQQLNSQTYLVEENAETN